MNEYTVYVHIDPEGKRYYGATRMDVKKRWKYGYGYRNNKNFWEAINIYGWNNIQHIIVAKDLPKEEAYWLEEELIKAWNTTNPNEGYNIAKGGPGFNGCIPSEDHRNKISKANKGNYHTEDAKKKMSEVKKGKRFTDDHKKKLSENHANVSGKNNPISKSVICLTTKRIFYSASEGSEYYNCNANNIRLCCKGKRKSSGKLNGEKLVWRYLIWNHNKKYRIKDRVSIDATEY